MELKNKTILVTGAGSGIGRELVLGLVRENAKVAAVDIKEETLEETKKLAGENGEKISTYIVNIADKPSVEALPDKVIAKQGQIDGVINNAGIIQPFVRVNDLEYDAIERVMNVNFYGTLYMIKAFLPHLLKRPEGYVVDVSSMGGFLPVPGQSVYGASKAAVKLLTEGLFAELLDTKVHVSVVFPGATKTNIAENSLGKTGMPKIDSDSNSKAKEYPTLPAEDAAKQIIMGMKNNKPQIFLGKDCKMMNFMYRLNPVYATKLIANQMGDLLKK